MNCCRPKRSSKSLSPTQTLSPEPKNVTHEVILRIPSCKVHLMDEGEALELANGDFTVVRVSDDGVFIATIVKVGNDLQWPLTKDEPVVKIDAVNYLFSLPMSEGDPLSYGVSFLEEKNGGSLGLLDKFLDEHSCFSSSSSSSLPSSSSASGRNKGVDWKEFAPRIENYNSVLGKAIAGGTGQIVKGIFKCSNAYTNKMQKAGGEMITKRAVEEKNGATAGESKSNKSSGGAKKSGLNKSLKRVRQLSKLTEKMSKAMLNGVGIVTGSVMGPVVRSQAGKAFLVMVPGEVLLASLDAVNKVLDAAEVAEKQAMSATSGAATRMVSQRFGENAGEATGHVLATAGHCAGTAWNIFKIRKTINPASSVTTGVINSASKGKKGKKST